MIIPVLIFFLLLVIGYISTKLFFKKLTFLELLGYSLFFSILVVPLIIIHLNFVGIVSGRLSLVVTCLIVILIYLFLIKKYKIDIFSVPKLDKKDYVVILSIIILAIFSFFYYNNSVYYLSLTSYLEKGETNCFYMLTFAMQPELKDFVASETPYDILSTPGNSMFTSYAHPVLELNSFRIMYVVFQVLLFLFTYLIINHFTKKHWISILTGFFAIFNPFNLYIEVLDRNFMALVVSVILFYTLFKHKNHVGLHGLIYGVLAGLGLRFLPIVFIVPIVLYYFSEKKSIKQYITFVLIAFAVFAYNIPHLKYHGFNSIGETESYLSLTETAFSKWIRTPFVPFPNLIFISMTLLNSFGYIISLVMLLGLYCLYKKSKLHGIIFSLIILLPLSSLAIQRDFIESPKLRIIILSFLSLYVLIAYGLVKLCELLEKYKFKIIIPTVFMFLILFSLVQIFSSANFDVDQRFYTRKLLYQEETPEYYEFVRQETSKVGLLPGFNDLGNKLNLVRKNKEQQAVIYNIFNRQSVLGYVEENNVKIQKPELPDINANEFVTLKINIDKLVTDLDNSVSIVDKEDNLFLDLSNKEELLDVYYKEFNVDWQNELLPLIIFPNFPDTVFLNEIYLDLNSFISYGEDEFGFRKINSIHYIFYPEAREFAKQTGMFGFPQFNDFSEITIKVPKESKIVIRNWFVNGANSQPFKIDSWHITLKNNKPVVKFQYNEPESYL